MNTENRFRAIGVLTLAAILSYAVLGTPVGQQQQDGKQGPAQVRTEATVGAQS